jgi:type II secretory ATPase GspE/PulE/Tfp pilus assembly ATPase PilB-like protein
MVPTTKGENVVMRLLVAESAHQSKLEDLGYSPKHANILRSAIMKPHGMVLSVGPTGSGKSTTLYTLLQMVNTPDVNVMTIEDPVEFNIDHIQQIPVNLKKNVTFATGLRSIVRQDPDIIMVGEIRDAETANIAVNAAMTGHLLLSTLHANDAATTFPRLIDLGVEPFLLASSLNIVIAQRLVRRICNRCRESYLLTPEEQLLVEHNPEIKKHLDKFSGNKPLAEVRLYRGGKCDDCNQTGYVGRIGIFEIFEIVQDLRTLIIAKSSADVITAKARELGMESMEADGIEKAFQGITTLEEIVRATKS